MKGDGNDQGAAPRSFIERAEQVFFFLVSALTLRVLGVAAGLASVVALGGLLWFSLPRQEPATPPALPALTLPGKPVVTADEVLRKAEAAPRPAEPVAAPPAAPAAPRPAVVAGKPEAPAPGPRSALDQDLDEFRAIAVKFKMPFENLVQRVCVAPAYNGRGCLSWDSRVTRRGLLEMVKASVFLDGEREEVQRALLQQARKLFAAIEATPAGAGDLGGLPAKDGFKVFVASFLQPALEMTQGYRRIQRATHRSVPETDRLRLVEDLYPSVLGVLAGMPEATPAARREAMGRTLALFQRKETARSRDLVTALREREQAEAERGRLIARERMEYESRVAQAGERRKQSLLVILASIAGVTLLGILLALLAIERHLRALKLSWSPAQQAPPAAEPPPLQPLEIVEATGEVTVDSA